MFDLDSFIKNSNNIDKQYDKFNRLVPGQNPGEPMYEAQLRAWEVAKEVFSRDVIPVTYARDIHHALTFDIPPFDEYESAGKYRHQDVWIGGHLGEKPYLLKKMTEEVLYLSMVDYMKYSDVNSQEEAEKIAFWIHNFYECIHPFIDGNGRSGRLILNAVIHSLGFEPIIIKYEERYPYYAQIEDFRKSTYKAYKKKIYK